VAFANAEAGVIGDPIFDTDAHDEAIQATKRAWQEHERRKKMEERQNTPGNGVEPFPFTMASNITLEPKEFLVDGFLGRYEVSAWYGPPDGGKSTVVVHAQACVAAGIEYCGRRVMHGPCLYVGAERGAVTKRRILARCREHGLPDIPLAVVDHAIDLRSGTVDTGRVIATAHELGELCGQPVVWINFDTWNRILAGGDENSSKDQGAVIKAVDHIHRETRAHVSFIHHVPVDRTDRMRGHGLVLGGVDLTARITKDSLVHVEVDKANDLIGKPAFAFDFKSVTLHVDTETGTETTAPVLVGVPGAAAAKSKPARKLSDRQRLAIDALTECLAAAGEAAPVSLQLPATLIVAPLDMWREELFANGVLDRDGPNPRQDFKQLSEQLQSRSLIGRRDNLVWKI
jgi:hypothetical protein